LTKKIDLRRIKLKQDERDIILATDVFHDKVLVAPAGTILNAKVKESLLGHGIEIVRVYDLDQYRLSMDESDFLSEVMTVTEEQKENFIGFVQDYEQMETHISETLDAVRAGKAIDTQHAFDITNGMITNARCKGDVFSYLHFMKEYDNQTATHSNNVALLSNIFGRWMRLPDDKLEILTLGGVLHDIGKMGIDHDILNKPGKLTDEEYEIVKSHAEKGYHLLMKYKLPEDAVLCALSHHEKIDGTGYPNGLVGDEINFYAKCIAIIDIFDAMTNHRSHRERRCPFSVIRQMEMGMFGSLDTELLLIFLKNIAENYLDAWVLLSDGTTAQVVFIHPRDISRPIVKTDADVYIDLSKHREMKIMSLK
jgi:putative nucleotidyltransferase with HDIG domain